jgi:CBS domain-containing protein
VNFIVHAHSLSVDAGGVTLRTYSAAQGTPGGVFGTPHAVVSENGMGEKPLPVYVAPLRYADDTLRMHKESTLAVADEGRLIGLVRREGLVRAGGEPVASVMEEAVSVKVDETLSVAKELEPTFGADPIPVTDHDEHLVGGLSLSSIRS